MRHEKIDGTTHIYVDDGETEQQVLRAIIKASFELAYPAGLGFLHFNREQPMTDEIADEFIQLGGTATIHQITREGMVPRPELGMTKAIVRMDYVQGRQCKTYITKVADEHFTLNNNAYERDRGLPDQMLDRAKDIIAGKQTPTGLLSSSEMYKGNNLALRLKEYGLKRQNGESDWGFRKRIFPDLYQLDPDRAMEFLMGCSAVEWDVTEQILCAAIVANGDPSRQELMRFTERFDNDPLLLREKMRAALFN